MTEKANHIIAAIDGPQHTVKAQAAAVALANAIELTEGELRLPDFAGQVALFVELGARLSFEAGWPPRGFFNHCEERVRNRRAQIERDGV